MVSQLNRIATHMLPAYCRSLHSELSVVNPTAPSPLVHIAKGRLLHAACSMNYDPQRKNHVTSDAKAPQFVEYIRSARFLPFTVAPRKEPIRTRDGHCECSYSRLPRCCHRAKPLLPPLHLNTHHHQFKVIQGLFQP